MMEELYLVVNYIWIDEKEITVGATDSERWRWDIEDGMSGADAKTLICIVLKDNGKGYAETELADISGLHHSEHQELCLKYIKDLSKIAWEIKEEGLDLKAARAVYFGRRIG